MHICIHGAGGLGSVLGGYLAESGVDVTLIARPAHAEAVNARGLRIFGSRGEHEVRDHLRACTHPDEVEGDIDYYILLTKVKDAAAALADARPLAPRVRCALTLQNGLDKEATLIACFGRDKVAGGSTIEGATLVEPGVAHNHVTVPVTAYFGELDGGTSARTEVLAQAFDAAGLGARAVEDITHVLWEKAVQVGGASLWSASTLIGRPALDYWDGLAYEHSARHYVTIARELLAVYHALGYAPENFFAPLSKLKEIDGMTPDEAAEVMQKVGRERQTPDRDPVRTSMHGDVLGGRETELEIIVKPILDAAARLGVAVPTVLGAYRVIKTVEHYRD